MTRFTKSAKATPVVMKNKLKNSPKEKKTKKQNVTMSEEVLFEESAESDVL